MGVGEGEGMGASAVWEGRDLGRTRSGQGAVGRVKVGAALRRARAMHASTRNEAGGKRGARPR
jgi:hypothetical protein